MTTLVLPIPGTFPARRQVDVLDAWLAGRSPHTLRAYRNDMEGFAAFLDAPGGSQAVTSLLAMDAGEANATALYYRASMTDAGLSPATVGRRLAALRSVVKCARMLGAVSWTLEVEAPKSEAYRDTRGPGEEGWRAMLASVRDRAAEGDALAIRDLAIVRLLHDLGLRRGELCALDYESIDQRAGTVAVVGKGRRRATELTLPRPTIEALAGWLAVRGGGPGPLFVRLDNAGSGGRLTGESVRIIVRDLGVDAGVGRAVRPHGLRHRGITSVLEKTKGDVRSGMKFARHSDPRTTMIYDDNREDVHGRMARLVAGE